MSLRCGCPSEGDDIVFGQVHECAKDPSLRYRKTPEPITGLVPSWAFVVPAETPAEIVLDEDERGGH